MKRGPVIAIDGPAGSGKSTIAKLLAAELNYTYIDTGAMYRAVALRAHELGIDIEDKTALEEFCLRVDLYFETREGLNRIFMDGEDYSEKIRQRFVGPLSSKVSSKKTVRDAMITIQRSLAEKGFVIMEGRDIGTVVLYDADIKFYLDASHEVRGRRRYLELKEKGGSDSLKDITEEIKVRDKRDSIREHSPLKKADDAVYIDTSDMGLRKVMTVMMEVIKERGLKER